MKCSRERVIWALGKLVQKVAFPSYNKFFPCGTAKTLLKQCHAFTEVVVKDFSVHGVIGHAQFPSLLTVANMYHFNGIGNNGDAMSFQEA